MVTFFPASLWRSGSRQANSDWINVIGRTEQPSSQTIRSCTQILSLQPRESGGGGGRSNDDIVTELAEELEAQIPPLLDDEDAGPTTFVLQVQCVSRFGSLFLLVV